MRRLTDLMLIKYLSIFVSVINGYPPSSLVNMASLVKLECQSQGNESSCLLLQPNSSPPWMVLWEGTSMWNMQKVS